MLHDMARRALHAIALVVAVSVTILLTPGRASGQQDVGPEQELAERYAPVFMLKAQEALCDSNGEQYAPAAADIVLDNDDVLLRQVGIGDPVVVVGPGPSDVHGRGEGFYLDFPGDAFEPGCVYETDFRRYSEGRPAVVYAHVATQADAPGQLALQYWFFYYYNDYNNLHEGDWEGIQLLFDVGTVEEALAVEPVSVGYSQHFGGERADWDDDKLERQGTHPVVYPAVGSHASYFNSTLYIGRSGSQGFGCDNTEGPSVALEAEVVVLPDAVDDPDDPLAWLAFEGFWGEKRSGPFSGATGPATKDRWTAPIDWHDGLRSASVAVPGGTDTDTQLIRTFCNVVGWGSARYIALQQNPLPTILMATVAVAAAVVVARRTDWGVVEPFPLARRRRLGQIVRAAARLYRERPFRFVEIGLVHLPVSILVGVVVILVQLLAMAMTPVEADGELGPIGLVVTAAVAGLGQAIASVIVTATVFALLADLGSGGEARGSEAYRRALERGRDLMSGLGRVILIVGLLAVSIIGLPWAVRQLVRYQFFAQVTMDEGLRGRAALDRSSALVSGRWLHTATFALVVTGLVSLVNAVIGLLLLLAVTPLPLWVFSVLATLASAVVAPFSATNLVLLYGDAKADKGDLGTAAPVVDAVAG